jgi:hexokinase
MFKRLIASLVCLTFSFSNLQYVHAQDFSVNQLPVPGTMVGISAPFAPLALKGLIVNPQKPLEFQFIVDTGKGPQDTASIKDQANQLVKYFLAGLTIPEGDLWVNLSPYEKDRMVPSALGQTDLGRDLLAQDYILKQLTASLIYPEKDLGKEFWSRVYAKAQKQFGTTNIPVNTFNKVWILPDQAQVFENRNAAYVTKSTLKVMLDEDYLALSKNECRGGSCIRPITGSTQGRPLQNDVNSLGSQVVRAIVIPEITKEVNTGKNFAPLRQIYQALILAKWYKETIQNGLLDAVYTNKNKVAGVNLNDPTVKEQIYDRYLQAYKKGAFNYIKEDPTPDGQAVPRKYFSGGILAMKFNLDPTGRQSDIKSPDGAMISLTVGIVAADAAMESGDQEKFWDEMIANANYSQRRVPDTVYSDTILSRLAPHSRVLSIGEGPTLMDIRQVLINGHHVVATNFTQQQIKNLQEAKQKENFSNLDVKPLDMREKFPFKDEQFDVVISRRAIGMYQTNKKFSETLHEIKRVLKKFQTSQIIFTVKSVDDRQYGIGDKIEEDMFVKRSSEQVSGGHIRKFWSPGSITNALEEAGFKVESIHPYQGVDLQGNPKDSLLLVVGTLDPKSFTEKPKDAAMKVEEAKEILSGKRILLVDDNEISRDFFEILLEQEGMIVEVADDGKAALELLNSRETSGEKFNFVLSDLNMLHMDGKKLAQQIRDSGKSYENVPMLIQTSGIGSKEVKVAQGSGVKMVSKRITDEELVIAIATELNSDAARATEGLFTKSVASIVGEILSRRKPLAGLSHLRSFVKAATGDEEGDYMAVDWGGTNLRVVLVRLQKGKAPQILDQFSVKATFPPEYVDGRKSKEEVFGFVAQTIAKAMKKIDADPELKGKPFGLGFGFSFPTESSASNSARLQQWMKGWAVPGVSMEQMGRENAPDIVKLAQTAIDANSQLKGRVTVKTIPNDATAITLASSGIIGVIGGTGFNIAVRDPETGEIINLEFPHFSDIPASLRTPFDERLFREAEPKNKSKFEKMVSGKYLIELLRYQLEDEIKDNSGLKALFEMPMVDSLVLSLAADSTVGLETMNVILSEKYGAKVLLTANERRILSKPSMDLLLRAGKLMGGAISGVLRAIDPSGNINNPVIGIDGNVINNPIVKEAVRETIVSNLGRQVELRSREDATAIGTAVSAAVPPLDAAMLIKFTVLRINVMSDVNKIVTYLNDADSDIRQAAMKRLEELATTPDLKYQVGLYGLSSQHDDTVEWALGMFLKSSRGKEERDQAMNGGIDLNQINVLHNGKTVNVQFDLAQLIQLEQGGFQGFTPVIINIQHISSPFQLLGINPPK